MFDARIRPIIDPPLNAAGEWLAVRGITADFVTIAGFVLGMAGALAIYMGDPTFALALIIVSRFADGLDGAVARASTKTDLGGFLDISLDFIFYGAVPLAFGTTFLTFSIMMERRKIETTAQGQKSLYYMSGLVEGFETIIALIALCIFPQYFTEISYTYAALCYLSAFGRILLAWQILADPPSQ